MMRITVDINGDEIAEIAVHNTQERRVIDEPDRSAIVETRYDVYDVYPNDVRSFDDTEPIGGVWHRRDGGASTLHEIVVDEIDLSEHFH